MKKFFFFITILFSFLTTCNAKVNVYFFTGKGCDYCNKALKYFHEHLEKYENYVDIKVYEVWNNKDNNAFYNDLKKYNLNPHTIPYVLIGDSFAINGYTEGQGSLILSKAYDLSSDTTYKDLGAEILKKHPNASFMSVEDALISEGLLASETSLKEYIIIGSVFIIIILSGFIIMKKAKII